MYLHIHKHAKAKNYMPRNVDTDELIKDCIWANDETGEYCVYARDSRGDFILIDDEYGESLVVKRQIKKGNIKLEKIK